MYYDNRITKRIDHFLINEGIFHGVSHIKQWVGEGECSNHFPIFIELQCDNLNPPNPFKFNAHWIVNEDYVMMVKRA